MAIDMVCGKIVDEDSATASTIYKGNVYHFCANYCRDVFNKEPEEFINDVKEGEKTTDPVCGMQIDFSDAAGRSLHKGRFIYFCTGACKEKFDADPEKYLKSEADDVEKKLTAPNLGHLKSEDGGISHIRNKLRRLRGQVRERAVEDERHTAGQSQFCLREGQRDLRSVAG